MIVEIQDEVFRQSAPRNDAALLDLFLLGFERRHVVRVVPTGSCVNFTAWRTRWGAHPVAEVVRIAIEQGIRDPRDRKRIRVVARSESDWHDRVPRLSVYDAWRLAHEPLAVVTEGVQAEPWFLRRALIAHREWRREIEDALMRGWLRFDLGGGLGNMRLRMEFELTEFARHRYWVLFDHDGDAAARPSAESERLRRSCKEAGVVHHVFKRRMVENYLPREVLEAQPSSAKFSAYLALPEEERHFFNLKSVDANVAQLFRNWNGEWRSEWFSAREDAPWRELSEIFRSILWNL